MPGELKISTHACERYIERFNNNLLSIDDKKLRYQKASAALLAIAEGAVYVSDTKTGILFENKSFGISYIVRNNCIRTCWQTSQKIKLREQKPREQRIVMIKKKYIRATFKNGAIYDFVVDDMIVLYAKLVLKEAADTSLEHAVTKAKQHFDENPDSLIEFMSSGLTWKDVVIEGTAIIKQLGNKDLEWPVCKKEYFEK